MAKKLLLSNYTLVHNSTEGTLVGNVTNKIAGSTLTLVDNAGGRIKLVGTAIQAGAAASIAGKYLINVKEQNSMASQITQIEITVT
jgi:hypothetical protein